MGLAERRRLKELRESVVPARQKELAAAAGVPLTLTVAWESLAEDTNPIMRLDEYCFQRVVDAFKDVCRDELGKEAVAAKVKRVHVINSTNSSWSETCQLQDGVLTLDWDWGNVLIVTPEMIAEQLGRQL